MKLPKKPAFYIVAVFVIVLLTFLSIQARAAEIGVETGSAMLRGETATLGLNINWPLAGPKNTDYEIGFLLSGGSTHRRANDPAFTGYAMIVDGYKKFEIGFGFAYTNSEWEYTCNGTATLMLRWRFSPRVTAQWHHFSSAGSCRPNAGRDFLTVGWRF